MPFLIGAVDRVLGHVARLGVDDRVAQAEVGVGIAAAGFGGDDDRLGELAPELAALGVDEPFFMGDVRPVGMSGHSGRSQDAGVRMQGSTAFER